MERIIVDCSKPIGEQAKKVKFTKAEIAEAEAAAVKYEAEQVELAKTQYQRDRAEEYPAIGEQLDAIWKELNQRRLNGEQLTPEADAMLGKILNVKEENPKPEKL